jgi:serine/threonine-protein kinase PknK
MQGLPRIPERPQLTELLASPSATEVPQLVGGRYRVLAPRGSGAESSVYLAVDLFTDREVALKMGAPSRLAAEYRRSASLLHPHLARALSLWRSPGSASLAFEYGDEDLTALRGCAEPIVVRHVAEIARGLGCLHRLGIVHGDVKPQNAVLAGAGGTRRALLVDLGLAGVEPAARGSLEYAAPEVLEGAAPDIAADLYSLGVMLHELLSGASPFTARTPAEVIRAHFDTVPPARASAGVQAVLAKLLAREPRSRYAQTDEVIEALAAATGLVLDVEGEGLAPDRIGLGQLHGRESELGRIEAASRRAAGGAGAQLLLVGPPGSGRTRLLRAAAIAAELAGLRTLCLTRGEGLAELYRWLGVLLGIGVSFEPSVGAARERLAAASAQHPLALLVDDADLGQDWLRALLLALVHDPLWREKPLLVIATAAQQIDPAFERVELRPLPPALGKAKLMEALGARSWAEGLSDRLVRESAGHPGSLEGAIRDLARRELLVRRRGRWELDLLSSGASFGGCVPRAAARDARTAIQALTESERTALGVAAVLWEVVDPHSLAGDDTRLLAEGLQVAERAGVSFSQLAVLRAAERALPPALRKQMHMRAARLTRDLAARAGHLLRAHARGRLRAALSAARERVRAGVPLDASRLYQVACAGLRHPLRSPRAALLCERAGDCLALAGQPAAARRQYARALGRGGDPGRLWQKVAKARWQEGRFDQVLEALSSARSAGADLLAVTTVEARAQAMRGDYARAEELATAVLPLARERRDAESATRLHHLLGTCAWHRGEGTRAVAEERAAVAIARRTGDRRAEADALAGLGTAYKLLASYDRSARVTALALELYRALGDERQEALAWINLGVARYLSGDWDGALDAWEKLTGKSGQTLEEELLNLNNLSFLYRERGDSPRAKSLLTRALDKVRRATGYARIEAMLCGNLGEIAAREGDAAGARALYRQTLEIAHRIGALDETVETERRLAELDLLLRDPAAASARASETLPLAVESGNLVEQGNLWRILALAARARGEGVAATSALRNAREPLGRAGAKLEMARADCVACLLELDRGDLVNATASLRRARVVFERLGAAPDLQEVERIEKDLEALQRKSFSHVEALTQAAQRLAGSSDPQAVLENALDEALLLTGADRGFILLNDAGAEPRVAAVRGAAAGATLRISRTVADRVLRTGEMLAVADIVGSEELSTRRSILDLGLRSVLCAPIRSGGRQLGLLYVDSRRVGSLLSDKDLGLLNAFAALAGSALDNARLIEDLRRKGDLLAQMTHEFRSPLQAIVLHADMARLKPEGDGHLGAICAHAARLSRIVDRTLDLFRVEAGALKLARARVDLAEVARTAIAAVEPFAQIKLIELLMSGEADVPKVEGDFDRLVQIVSNLLGNAVQYSGKGSRVWVKLASAAPLLPARPQPRIEVDDGPPPAELAPQRSAEVLVIDQGPGIPADEMGRIFTPFFRGAEGTGAGLGLVISRQIAREHGGDLRVESRPGEGATFVLSLPGAP